MKFWILTIVLALAGEGCSSNSRNTTTEADRLVNSQSLGAVQLGVAEVMLAFAGITLAPEVKAHLDTALVAFDDVKKNCQQQEEVHGAPEQKLEYSPDNADKARKQSTQQHAPNRFWVWITGAIGIGLAAVRWGAQYVPALARIALGPIFTTAETSIQFINDLRKKGKITPEELAELEKKQGLAQRFISWWVKRIEKKHGGPEEPKSDPAPVPEAVASSKT